MGSEKILIIDDEKSFLNAVARNLEAEGFKTVYTDNPNEGLILARETKVNLILTDAQIEPIDGFAVCKAIKENKETANLPVIIMSGKDIEEEDVLKGFDKGADDYIIKPFSFKVLTAKIKAVLKRYEKNEEKSSSIKKMGIVFDPDSRTVKTGDNLIKLTRKEFDLLNMFLANPGKVLHTSNILQTVWGYDPALYNDPHTVEVHVYSLRKKLTGKISKKIVSVPGVGYKLDI
ncbi:MAG: response regulator transcription factor [Elusimicrobia bacterium]|nr:response regulator transcription factor [Elusimicrobiota bacterium]